MLGEVLIKMLERERIQQRILLLKKAVVDLEVEKQRLDQHLETQTKSSSSIRLLSFEGRLSRPYFAFLSIPIVALIGTGIFFLGHPIIRYPAFLILLFSIWSMCALTTQRLGDLRKHSALMVFLFFPLVNIFFYVYLLFSPSKKH